MEMILMVGIPGCGKTTLARAAFPSHTHISLDVMKMSCPDLKHSLLQRYEEEVSPQDPGLSKNRRAEYVLVRDALQGGCNIVIDDTNVSKKLRQNHIGLARKHGATVNAIFFQNIQRAYTQNDRRPDPVPKKALDEFYRDLEPPHEDEGISFVQMVY